jgi:hypothetical protein
MGVLTPEGRNAFMSKIKEQELRDTLRIVYKRLIESNRKYGAEHVETIAIRKHYLELKALRDELEKSNVRLLEVNEKFLKRLDSALANKKQ